MRRTVAAGGFLVLSVFGLRLEAQQPAPAAVDGSKDVAGIGLKFSQRRSEVTGVVTNPAGQAVADHTVVLFPSDRRLWLPQSRRIRTSQPGRDGRYAFRDLPAGEYHVVALLDLEPGRQLDAEYRPARAAVFRREARGR